MPAAQGAVGPLALRPLQLRAARLQQAQQAAAGRLGLGLALLLLAAEKSLALGQALPLVVAGHLGLGPPQLLPRLAMQAVKGLSA